MAENDKDYKPKGENDRFTRLMFGNSKQSDIDESDDHQVHSEQKNNSKFVRESSGLDDWFLGNRRKALEKKSTKHLNTIENTLKNVDLELLMETMHMFVTTSNQYKPIIKEVSPYFNSFLKKFKSNKD
ncbi:hypothetical protein P9D43_01680 [Neobacillus niacini]|uniref:hypothetical protein n=1 Tax=Neobacillus niacini TaxID=86668 RepID=UPI0007AC0B79|nr:hypothetical protein [Neobacillus niacini]MEC1520741.1 hypothetical protein [Neobacillus niacini]